MQRIKTSNENSSSWKVKQTGKSLNPNLRQQLTNHTLSIETTGVGFDPYISERIINNYISIGLCNSTPRYIPKTTEKSTHTFMLTVALFIISKVEPVQMSVNR